MYNYLTLGYDCSAAVALRDMGLREFALPFDWVQSNINSLERCFSENFLKYHTGLKFNFKHTRLIDEYGFEFPHDYPFNNMNCSNNIIGEGFFEENPNSKIISNWNDYYNVIKEKYERRIERFRTIITDTKPIIVLCRYNIKDVQKLQQLFIKYYNKSNIYFVNSNSSPFETDKIINIYTEKNNVWNETKLWKEGLNKILLKII